MSFQNACGRLGRQTSARLKITFVDMTYPKGWTGSLPLCPLIFSWCYLSDEGRLRKTANSFGLSRPCVFVIIRRVTRAVTLHLGPNYMTLPIPGNAIEDALTNFLKSFPIPQFLGAIDGTHIAIRQTQENPTDYSNRKGYHSLNVQVCCDKSTVSWMSQVAVKWPKSVHDARMFANSKLNDLLKSGKIPQCRRQVIFILFYIMYNLLLLLFNKVDAQKSIN